MRLLLTISLMMVFSTGALVAQKIFERKKQEVFPTNGKMKLSGFYVAPGATYALGPFSDNEQTFFPDADTSYAAEFSGSGSLGIYLEAGWFKALNDPYILDYIDFGLAYKQLKGVEEYEGEVLANDVILGTTVGENTFRDNYLTAHFNANKLVQTSDFQFVQFSLGVNADYRIGRSLESVAHPISTDHDFPPSWVTQAHFKVGYGFKVSNRFMVIPMLETPIFSVTPQDRDFGQLQWFNTRYRPLILSIRFLWLRYPNGFDCPEFESGGSGKRKKQQPYKPKTYHPE